MTSFSRVIVFGAGALGSLIGGKLSKRLPVVLVTRGAHLAAMRERGLQLGGLSDAMLPLSDNFAVVERIEELASGVRSGDLILLTVKTLQVREAADSLVTHWEDAAQISVLALQNGTGFEDALRALLSAKADLQLGVAFSGATLREPGIVDDWGGELLLPTGPAYETLAREWTAAGQSASAVADLEKQRWQKIVFNCGLNVFSVILNVRNNETVRPEWRVLRRAILREARVLAQAVGVVLPDENELLETLEARALTSRNVNSMLQDICRGRPTEIDYLNGAVARLAKKRGENAPANAAVAGWIRRFEQMQPDQHEALRAAAVSELLSWRDG